MLCVATPGEKLSWLRRNTRPKLSQEELAEYLGGEISRGVVANWESDRTDLPDEIAKKIARKYGKQWDWFYDGGDVPGRPTMKESAVEVRPQQKLSPGFTPPNPVGSGGMAESSGRRLFPILGTAGAAAAPIYSEDVVDDFIDFSDDVYSPDRFAIRVKGKSMEDIIQEGDFILVQPSLFLYEGMLAVARNDEWEFCIKNYAVQEGRPVLLPENPTFEPIIPGDGWQIVGYAVGWKRLYEKGGGYAEIAFNTGIRIKQNMHIVPFDL
jgi:SOS-response transcriptional repressor LexA